MCIIAYKPEGQTIDRKTLEICFQNNPDGAGYMFPCEGRVLIQKGFFEFPAFWSAWEKTHKIHGDSLPVVFHFRIATAGMVDKTNCHPHRIASDLAFVHNGVLSCVNVPKGSTRSDTILYRNRHLRDMAGHSLHNNKRFNKIAKHIGKYNKFVFMNGQGKTVICNESEGLWDAGVWYSNTSFLAVKPAFGMSAWDLDDFHFCEYYGKELDTQEERTEGACFDCLDYYWPNEYQECGGCQRALVSNAHKLAGWCDDCGVEVYGKEWPEKLREAAACVGAIHE